MELHLPTGSAGFVGRYDYLMKLNAFLPDPDIGVLNFIAPGGTGKSALVGAWLRSIKPDYKGAKKVFGWSFYSQGTHETQTTSANFFAKALPFFGYEGETLTEDGERAEQLGKLLRHQPSLLILDGTIETVIPDHTYCIKHIKESAETHKTMQRLLYLSEAGRKSLKA